MKYLTSFLAFLLLLIGPSLVGQTANLSISSQSISSGTYTFTMAIRASGGDIYLGNSDFILTFNNAAFGIPSINRVADGDFRTESNDDFDALFTKRSYSNSTAASISGNTIRINLSGPNPGSVSAFNTGVAKIPSGSTVHFGTFSIIGYQGNDPIELKWNSSATQMSTIVLPSLNEVSIGISVINPAEALPVEMLYFTAGKKDKSMAYLQWATASEAGNSGFAMSVASTSKRSFCSNLQPLFSKEKSR